MNGVAFAELPQLVEIELRENVCINKLFEIERGSNKFRRKISRSCASADTVKKDLSCSTSIACDKMRQHWKFMIPEKDASSCCELEYETKIDAPDYKFALTQSDFQMLIIEHQQNVEFLPVLLHESFPILKRYYVKNTAVPKISKKNFESLFKLEDLGLNRNQIEVIKSDTFEDLVSLQTIIIGE